MKYTSKSVMHLDLIFICGTMFGLECLFFFFFFTNSCQVVLTLFVEKTILSSLILYLCQNPLSIYIWIYFQSLFCTGYICLFILIPIPHFLDYFRFVVSLKASGLNLLSLSFFSQWQVTLVALDFCKTFRISLLISSQRVWLREDGWGSNWDGFEPLGHFVENCHFDDIDSFNP